mmetsp:Transcript_5248/g.7639  ORF Transcript_5248/g.7639 Transcript_5248/m.7639 type:complete len:112 (+) Transcript_5248:106-441(+)
MSENTVTPILFVEAVNSYSNFAFVIPFSNPASRRWMHFHGVSPDICCDVWKRLDVVNTMAAEGINGAQPKHLMWALCFLKVYGKEEDNDCPDTCELGTFCVGNDKSHQCSG